MVIFLKKFGTILISRPDGREAFLAFQSTLNKLKDDEKIEIDFNEVDVLSPSWADEFITPMKEKYNNKIILKNTDNPSVKATLEFLEKIKEIK